MTTRFVAGLVLAAIVSFVARRAGTLSMGGARAATVLGAISVAAGWDWGVLLMVYFLSTTALSRHRADEKHSRAGDLIEKGGARDAVQVLANGGVFALAALGFLGNGAGSWLGVGAGALGAAAADSWATEMGILSREPPRLIGSDELVEPGTSGGITSAGIFGAIAGATTVATAAALLGWSNAAAGAAFNAGMAGMFFDSFLGARLQAKHFCPACKRETERSVHSCGARTVFVRGVRWMDNDAVNALTTVLGGLVGVAAYIAIS